MPVKFVMTCDVCGAETDTNMFDDNQIYSWLTPTIQVRNGKKGWEHWTRIDVSASAYGRAERQCCPFHTENDVLCKRCFAAAVRQIADLVDVDMAAFPVAAVPTDCENCSDEQVELAGR